MQSIPGPEPTYIGNFRILGYQYAHRAPAHLSSQTQTEKETYASFATKGLKHFLTKRSWLMIFVLNLLLYNHWHNHVIYCFWEMEVWGSTMTCFPNLVRLKCGKPIEIKVTSVGAFWLVKLSLIGSWASWDLKKFVPSLSGQVAERSGDKAGVLGRGLGEQRWACDKCTRKEKCPKAARFSFKAWTEWCAFSAWSESIYFLVLKIVYVLIFRWHCVAYTPWNNKHWGLDVKIQLE